MAPDLPPPIEQVLEANGADEVVFPVDLR